MFEKCRKSTSSYRWFRRMGEGATPAHFAIYGNNEAVCGLPVPKKNHIVIVDDNFPDNKRCPRCVSCVSQLGVKYAQCQAQADGSGASYNLIFRYLQQAHGKYIPVNESNDSSDFVSFLQGIPETFPEIVSYLSRMQSCNKNSKQRRTK